VIFLMRFIFIRYIVREKRKISLYNNRYIKQAQGQHTVTKMQDPTVSPIQKLDAVLRFISFSSYADGISKSANLYIWFKNQTKIELEGSEFLEVLNKLVSEKYVREEIRNDPETEEALSFYSRTFDGKYFSTKGGYEQESKSLDERKRWADNLLEKGDQNAKRLNRYTLILGVGTVGLVLIELVKFFYELFCQSHH
jgi:hypothetical protein